jgi:hydroxymethylpyrimidine pyrophosphatase-like HAD family hydrolase
MPSKQMHKSLLIAVDFDGTIVKNAYPKIGKEQFFAFDTLKKLQNAGHRLILWTVRSGKVLDEAIVYCKANGIEFYAINNTYPEEVFSPKISRKIVADIFIDDRNIGGFIGWGEIHQLLLNDTKNVPEKKSFLGKLFS